MDKVGKEGVITVEDGKSLNNELDIVEACSSTRLPVAVLHQPADKQIAILENPTCCCTTRRSATSATCCRAGAGGEGRPAAADRRRGSRGEALATLVVNSIRGFSNLRRQGAGLR